MPHHLLKQARSRQSSRIGQIKRCGGIGQPVLVKLGYGALMETSVAICEENAPLSHLVLGTLKGKIAMDAEHFDAPDADVAALFHADR